MVENEVIVSNITTPIAKCRTTVNNLMGSRLEMGLEEILLIAGILIDYKV